MPEKGNDALAGPNASGHRDDEQVLLRLNAVSAGYGKFLVLRDVSFRLHEADVLGVIGPNGAGKSTLLRTISGLTTRYGGNVWLAGVDLNKVAPYRRAALGLAHVPEGRRVFKEMPVIENLLVVADSLKGNRRGLMDRVFELFPELAQRKRQKAGSLSGGEQQMLAIGRALMSDPKLLMLDEPSQGLSPVAVDRVAHSVKEIARLGISAVVVEQNAKALTGLATRLLVVSDGHAVEAPLSTLSMQDALKTLLGGVAE